MKKKFSSLKNSFHLIDVIGISLGGPSRHYLRILRYRRGHGVRGHLLVILMILQLRMNGMRKGGISSRRCTCQAIISGLLVHVQVLLRGCGLLLCCRWHIGSRVIPRRRRRIGPAVSRIWIALDVIGIAGRRLRRQDPLYVLIGRIGYSIVRHEVHGAVALNVGRGIQRGAVIIRDGNGRVASGLYGKSVVNVPRAAAAAAVAASHA